MRILVLVHQDCVPPVRATFAQADWAVWKTEYYVVRALRDLGHRVEVLPLGAELAPLDQALATFRPQVVFNLLVEFAGESWFESHIAAYLELKGIPYTGCNPLGLSLSRDKALCKKILAAEGVPTPGFMCIPKAPPSKPVRISGLNLPLMVKSLTEEASLGISQSSVVESLDKLQDRVEFIHHQLGTDALVEEYIPGRELYVGVLGNKSLTVLPPWELHFGELNKTGHPIATRNVKFNRQYCERHQIRRGPAEDLNPFVRRKIEHLSRTAYRALRLSGFARLDFRLTPQNELFLLEANPNAELAKGECLANAAKFHGWSYPQLVSKVLGLAKSYRVAA